MKYTFLCLLLILTGCSYYIPIYKTNFIVQRDVPQNPTFTVMPNNNSFSEVAFAQVVEACLIGARVKVVQLPATKSVQTEEVRTKKKTTPEPALEGKGTVVTETYLAYEPTNADYYIQTNSVSRQMKVVKTETQEVLAILIMPKVFPIEDNGQRRTTSETPYSYMAKALFNLGIIKQKKAQ